MKTVRVYFNNNTKQQQAFRPRNYSIDHESDDDQSTIKRDNLSAASLCDWTFEQ